MYVSTINLHTVWVFESLFRRRIVWRGSKQTFHLTKCVASASVLFLNDVCVLFPPTWLHALDTHPHHRGDNGNIAQVEIMCLRWPSSQWKENNDSFYLDSPACNCTKIITDNQSSSFLICFSLVWVMSKRLSCDNISLSFVFRRLRCQRPWILRTLWSRCVCLS